MCLSNSDRMVINSLRIEPGLQAQVEYDPGSKLVSKTFTNRDRDTAAALARREFAYLRKFADALAEVPSITCPDAVDVEPCAGRVWMTYCSGERLDQLLANPGANTVLDLPRIAKQISTALRIYIDTFDEPFFDFTTHNMLYDRESGTLTLFDFAPPDGIYSTFDPVSVRYELSLGNFIASTTYHTLKRRTWANIGYWKRQREVSAAVIQELATATTIDVELTARVQREKWSSVTAHGPGSRIFWFSTVGRIIYEVRVKSLNRVLRKAVRANTAPVALARRATRPEIDDVKTGTLQ